MTERRAKYNAIRTEVDGIKFASQAEARRYQELKILEASGEIKDLKLQHKFPIMVNEIKVCVYICDFIYREVSINRVVVEDVKGVKTPEYRLKKKLMFACYGIEIRETK